jgi:hypothetical protein
MEDEIHSVRVTNKNNSWNVVDRHGGQVWKFPAGETVIVPSEVAEHIFGYGLDEKGRWQKFLRMGIANHPKGREMWGKIELKRVGSNVEPTGALRQAA